MTQAALDALVNSLLASGQSDRITANKHRTVEDAIIDELFDVQSRGDLFNALTDLLSYAGTERIVVIKDGVAYTLPTSLLVTPPAIGGTVVYCSAVSLASNLFPTTGGTGASGAIKKGNSFKVTTASTTLFGPDGGVIQVGTMIMALVDTPGQTVANWQLTPGTA